MGKLPLLALVLALATASAGCFGASEEPPAGDANPPPPAGNNNTAPPPQVLNGTDTVAGGPQAAKTITISVPTNYTRLEATFVAAGTLSGSPIGGAAIQQFTATLKDPQGNATATSNALGTAVGADNPAAGDWTLEVSFRSAPSESVVVTWAVTP